MAAGALEGRTGAARRREDAGCEASGKAMRGAVSQRGGRQWGGLKSSEEICLLRLALD
jgi:hypothetical protein